MTTEATERRRVQMRILPSYVPARAWKGRYLVLYGGAGSGKSWFAAQRIIERCLSEPNHRFLVARKVAKTLRASCFQLFRDVLGGLQWTRHCRINLSEMVITFPNGSSIMHAGLDDVEKLKSLAQPTGIWIEEATEITEADFVQLDLRLRGPTPSFKQIILTFNPISHLHWLKRYFVDEQLDGAKVFRTTFLDNRHAGAEYAKVFSRIKDERLRAVYERGEWGVIAKGLIYTEWDLVDAIPDDVETVYGLDFGFNNPTALVRIGSKEDVIWAEELLYESELTNSVLIERLADLIPDRRVPIYCDAAEPQRIEEIHRAGFNAKPADKDVNKGIDSVKSRSLFIVRGSQNLINELGTYKWSEDKDGNVLDRPVKFMDHALDALRYGVHTHWANRKTLWLIG